MSTLLTTIKITTYASFSFPTLLIHLILPPLYSSGLLRRVVETTHVKYPPNVQFCAFCTVWLAPWVRIEEAGVGEAPLTAHALLPNTAYNLIILVWEHRQSPQGMSQLAKRSACEAEGMLRQSWQPAGGTSPAFPVSSTGRELGPQSRTPSPTGAIWGVRCVWGGCHSGLTEVLSFPLLPRKMLLQ